MAMDFAKYMEEYRDWLTDSSDFDVLVHNAHNAHNDHRLQKLLVLYMMKDKETFEHALKVAKSNEFAMKLVNHAQTTLYKFKYTRKYDCSKKYELVSHLYSNSGFNENSYKEVEMEEWEYLGYCKLLNNYLVNDRINNLSNDLRERVKAKMQTINMENILSAR